MRARALSVCVLSLGTHWRGGGAELSGPLSARRRFCRNGVACIRWRIWALHALPMAESVVPREFQECCGSGAWPRASCGLFDVAHGTAVRLVVVVKNVWGSWACRDFGDGRFSLAASSNLND